MNEETGAFRSANYKLVIRGQLDPRFDYLFDPLRLERSGGRTILCGRVADQAQLYGFLGRIEELRLELLSVERVDD